MLLPVKWMKDYVHIDNSDREIADKITDTGSHVESINTYNYDLSNIVVAQVRDVEKVEELKHLLKVLVYDGKEEISVLTGAKNVYKDNKVILAKIGAEMPNGMKIEKETIEGYESNGMLVSYEELGFSDSVVPKNSNKGIAILGEDVEVGQNISETLDLDKSILELEITPNRPDCLSITGMAREVAACFDQKIEMPNNEYNFDFNIGKYLDSIEIESKNCSTFIARVVENVEVKASPQWIQNRLMQAGIRPINNLVDLGNFVMLEYGQALHVYDLDKIEGRKIIVRDAKNGESIKTIDSNIRKLDEDMLVIANEKEPICIAGIMGGYDTEVTEDTKNILLEAAVFDSSNIRRTSKKLNLVSESSQRNEKGSNPISAQEASKRFMYLLKEENIGDSFSDFLLVGQDKLEDKNIILRVSRVNDLIGMEFTKDEIIRRLKSLEFEIKDLSDNEILVSVPYFRQDINIEVDLIEEFVRMFGLDKVVTKPLRLDTFPGRKSDIREFKDKAIETFYSLGLDEILTYSFISPKQFDKARIDINDNIVKIFNPLGEDFSVMRTSLIGNMLDVLHKNINNRMEDLRFFEVGNIFLNKGQGIIPEERLMACVGLYGKYDFYYFKDLIVKSLGKLGLNNLVFKKNKENKTFHSGRCASIYINDIEIGVLGELHPIVKENYQINDNSYICEIDLLKAFDNSNKDLKYKEIIKYPAIERDISLVIDRDLESSSIEKVIRENAGQYLQEIRLFDIYTGKQIDDDKKSYAYKLKFISKDRTLEDKEVNEAFNRIVDALKDAFSIDLRI